MMSKGEELFRSLGDLSDDLIADVDTGLKAKKEKRDPGGIAAAAVILLLAGSVFFAVHNRQNAASIPAQKPETNKSQQAEEVQTEEMQAEHSDAYPDAQMYAANSTDKEISATEKALEQYANLGIVTGVKNYLNMRSGPSTDDDIVGIIFQYCGMDILEEKDGWYRISSGGVEGYVCADYVATGTEARQLALENLTYYAEVIPESLNVFTSSGEYLTTIRQGEKYRILDRADDSEEDLVCVEAVDSIKGYVNSADVSCAYSLDDAIVFSYEGISTLRKNIIEYALQYYGSPYVWSGHDLETGVDSSGFVYQVYREFGIDLIEPYSIAQATVGSTVTEETIKPGDLVFYVGRFPGQIGHAAIYMGNEMILHVMPGKGVCVSSWKYVPPVVMKNVIGE